MWRKLGLLLVLFLLLSSFLFSVDYAEGTISIADGAREIIKSAEKLKQNEEQVQNELKALRKSLEASEENNRQLSIEYQNYQLQTSLKLNELSNSLESSSNTMEIMKYTIIALGAIAIAEGLIITLKD